MRQRSKANGRVVPAGSKKPIAETRTRLEQRFGTTCQDVTVQKMARQLEPLLNFRPTRIGAASKEVRKRQQLSCVWLGFGSTHRASRSRTHRNQLVIGAGHRAAIEVQPK